MGHWGLGIANKQGRQGRNLFNNSSLSPLLAIWEIVGFNWKLTYLVTCLNCVLQSPKLLYLGIRNYFLQISANLIKHGRNILYLPGRRPCYMASAGFICYNLGLCLALSRTIA